MDRCSRWGKQECDRMEIFLGSHHFFFIMKHTPPPLDWDMWWTRTSDDDIEAYSDTVTCFIRKCVEDVDKNDHGLTAMFEQPCQHGHLSLNPETLTIENKPVTIPGNPSKLPNDNIKTKLKNNSTPTMQEACGRASTTSQVLKGINKLLWTLPPLYRTIFIIFMLVLMLTTPPTQRALLQLQQKTRVHSLFLSRM